jgi:3-oxoadipate enol-lactonase
MTEPSPCPLESNAVCGSALPATVNGAMDRFRREAQRGVCDTGRYRCPYFTWGQGPPLVFIHGLSDAGASFILVIARLVEYFRCIAYEMPRGGGDGARLNRYTHADMVDDLFALLDHLGARQGYLLGSSFGSTVTLAAMLARPERIPRGILAGGFAYRRLAPAERLLADLSRYWSGTMAELPFRTAVLRRSHQGAFAAREPEAWDFYLSQTGGNPIAAVARRALLMHRLDLRPLLSRVQQPVLMVCGDCDPLVGKSCEKALVTGLPHVRRVELVGCGHFPHFTHPEVLAELIREFLTPPPVED